MSPCECKYFSSAVLTHPCICLLLLLFVICTQRRILNTRRHLALCQFLWAMPFCLFYISFFYTGVDLMSPADMLSFAANAYFVLLNLSFDTLLHWDNQLIIVIAVTQRSSVGIVQSSDQLIVPDHKMPYRFEIASHLFLPIISSTLVQYYFNSTQFLNIWFWFSYWNFYLRSLSVFVIT